MENCQFCLSQLPEKALVCAHCGRCQVPSEELKSNRYLIEEKLKPTSLFLRYLYTTVGVLGSVFSISLLFDIDKYVVAPLGVSVLIAACFWVRQDYKTQEKQASVLLEELSYKDDLQIAKNF